MPSSKDSFYDRVYMHHVSWIYDLKLETKYKGNNEVVKWSTNGYKWELNS